MQKTIASRRYMLAALVCVGFVAVAFMVAPSAGAQASMWSRDITDNNTDQAFTL